MGEQTQVVPSDNMQQDQQVIEQKMRQGLQNRTTLAPLGINPKLGSPSMGKEIGMSLLGMFVPGVGGALQHHIKQQKETQINQVVNDFTTLSSVWDEVQSMSSGDKQKATQMFTQDPRVAAILGDKKKQKLLSKAFNIDLMSPDKTQNNVAFQGLQRFLNLKNAKGNIDQIKSMLDSVTSQGVSDVGKQSQPQAQQQPQGQPSQDKPQSPAEQSAQNFLDRWPKQVHQPSTTDVEHSAQTIRSLVAARTESEPKTEFEAWYRAEKKEKGEVTKAALDTHHEAWKLKAQDQLAIDAMDKARNGDVSGAQQDMDLIHNLMQAMHPVAHKTPLDMIYGMNQGNKEDKEAYERYLADQKELRMAYGEGRAAWTPQQYLGPDGTIHLMSSLDALNMIHRGENPGVPIGKMNVTQELAFQQLFSEAGPKGSDTWNQGVIKELYENLDAFDNPKNRAIFATAFRTAEHSSDTLDFLRNIIRQVSTDELDDNGKRLFTVVKRLGETLGRARAVAGVPATNYGMELTLNMFNPAVVADKAMGEMQLDQLDKWITNTSVPILTGKPRGQVDKPKGKMSLDEFLKGGAKDSSKPESKDKSELESIPKPAAPVRTKEAEKVSIGGKEFYVVGENADGTPKLAEIHKEKK